MVVRFVDIDGILLFILNNRNCKVNRFVSELRQVGGFIPCPPASSTNKADCHDIAKTLLKVELKEFLFVSGQKAPTLNPRPPMSFIIHVLLIQ